MELSGGRGLAGQQALCQRGQLRQLAGEQEQALDDYRRAAKLGSRFAKTQVCLGYLTHPSLERHHTVPIHSHS